MNAVQPIFDRDLFRQRLARAARGEPADFLLRHVAEEIEERLDTVKRGFAAWADLGTPSPLLAARLAARRPGGLRLAPGPEPQSGLPQIIGSLELLPLAPARFDLIVSAFALQSIDDVPGTLIQIRRCLKPDGLFFGVLLGGQTLTELRQVLTEAELGLKGGASPRVAPFGDVRDFGALLQRAGFALPVVDSDTLTVRYPDLFGLMADLRAMGATNVLTSRSRRPTPRGLFLEAARLYADRFGDNDGRIRATFELISLAGWSPHESQQKPAPRGSGKVSLADVLPPRA